MFEGSWRVVLHSNLGGSDVADDGAALTVGGRQPDATLERWMKQRAVERFDEVLAVRTAEMGLTPARVSLRDQKTKWGACTSRGTVTFNWRLVMAPAEVLDYVVVHELAHLKELNHSKKYWRIVETYCPDHKVHRKWLRDNGRYLRLPNTPEMSGEPSLD